MHKKNRKKFSKRVGGREKKTKLGYLPEDTLSYYRRVSEALIEGFENEEDKNIFLNNSFDQLIQESLTVAQNQTASRIIELLISEASASNLRRLFVSMCSDLSVAFLDRFASHVFQALIQLLPKFILPQSELKTEGKAVENEEDDVDQGIIEESFKSVCSFVEKTFEVLFCHTYGSHVIRALMEVLGGVQVSHELSKGHGSHEDHHDRAPEGCNVSLPSEFRSQFDQFTEKIFHLCDNEVYLKDPSASPLVQTVLLILNKIDPVQCHLHCKTIMQQVALTCVETKNPAEVIPDLAQSQVGSHLLEVIFKLSPALEEIFSSLLKGRLLQYAIHPVANYVLQRFIYSLKDRDLMKKVYLELSKYVEDILAVGHLGLITCLADSCRRLHVCQDEFVTVLMEAFHCKEPEERNIYLTRLILSFVTYEVFFKVDSATEEKSAEKSEEKLLSSLNMHGSLLLQQLLQFDKPKIIALGVTAMKPAELNIMCCDPSGSHAVDVFFSSPTILDKTKEMFLKKMKGLFVETGCSKNGSRCLENIWKNLDVKQRKRIAEELSQNEDRLRRDRFGHFLYRNLGLNQFVKRRNDWLEHQGVLSKRRRMLTQLLHGKAAPEKKEDSSLPLESDGEEDKVSAIFNKLAHAKQAFERVTSNSKQDTNDSEFNSLATAKKRKRTHTDLLANEQSHRKKNKQTETNESNLEAHPKKSVKKREKQTGQNETKTYERSLATHPDKPLKKKKADQNETKTNEGSLATHPDKPVKKKKKRADQNDTKTNESSLATHPKKPGIMKKKGKKVTNEKCETPETENVDVISEGGTQFVHKKSKKNKIKG